MIFATANKHKLREMGELLPGFELEPLPAGVELPPEEGDSFAEIALEKARTAHTATGEAAIGDDSGIEAMGLGGRPGIHSARYGGPVTLEAERRSGTSSSDGSPPACMRECARARQWSEYSGRSAAPHLPFPLQT